MVELMTLHELAGYLRVTEKTVHRLLKRGDVPATRVGHQWRFYRERIDDWLSKQATGQVASILVVDDEENVRSLFEEVLQELGHKVVSVESAAVALDLVKKSEFDLVFLDLKMPGMDGAELLREIRTIRPGLPVTIITGYPDSELMARVLALGPFGVMNKPFGESDIRSAIGSFLKLAK